MAIKKGMDQILAWIIAFTAAGATYGIGYGVVKVAGGKSHGHEEEEIADTPHHDGHGDEAAHHGDEAAHHGEEAHQGHGATTHEEKHEEASDHQTEHQPDHGATAASTDQHGNAKGHGDNESAHDAPTDHAPSPGKTEHGHDAHESKDNKHSPSKANKPGVKKKHGSQH